MMTKETIRNSIVAAGKAFMASGLTIGSWGNISLRDGDLIGITPSGLGYDKMTEADVVILGEQNQRRPSSELPLHLAIYSARQDVQAIVHTHSIFATALAVAHRDLPIIAEDGACLAEDGIHCARYALAGTVELAENAVRALGQNNAVFLSNHGALVCAGNMEQALLYAQLLEKMAKIYYLAQNLGGAFSIAPDNIKKLREFYFNTYSKLQGGKEK